MQKQGSMLVGIIFLVIGAAIILKVVFKLDLPVFKLLAAGVFIYIGIRIMFGGTLFQRSTENENSAIFSESTYRGEPDMEKSEYNAVFGKINLDLQQLELKQPKTKIIVNAVFGGAEIKLPAEIPVKIKSDVIFGGAQLPEGNSGGFGTYRYKSDNFDENQPYLILEINAIFGGAQVYR
jgi:predicted membrane protein